jgi:aspartyl aminopeptidase
MSNKLIDRMCNFITASPTPFQAVHNLTSRLISSSFTKLSEKTITPSQLKAGGKYFYTRNQSSLVAFTMPHRPTSQTAISFAVGHLDSPCLKIRPVSKKSKAGYLQVGVELYGGGIWHSWFDRDLSIAGRVIVKSDSMDGEGFVSKLVKVDRPLLRIPTLAIHLERGVNEQ